MTKLKQILYLLFMTLGFAWTPLLTLAKQKLSLPSLFSDHIVLQQKTKIEVWGQSALGEKLTVSAGWGKAVTTTTPGAIAAVLRSLIKRDCLRQHLLRKSKVFTYPNIGRGRNEHI